ncbi:glycerate kinase [Pelagibaculum spongiae]|uniref:Glycerate kinase n=1 Tax=Pelagibaculum spongiae TaxID=2080658 RepID=A0A2V1H1H8_9GAMM|nr:glycerate kinase [Pelagibaculum spongiae]PVZ72373.1 glycerate kinase [Pelagibaculum spongiae]
MKILIAPDSFKGSMDALNAAEIIKKGCLIANPNAHCVIQPIADGGEGTLEILLQQLHGHAIYFNVNDALSSSIKAPLGWVAEQQLAIIEIASIVGLYSLNKTRRNPALTSTFGVGQLIKHALKLGAKTILITLGGSSTNDGGVGMLQALGAVFLDQSGNDLPLGGIAIKQLHKIDLKRLDSRLAQCNIIAACDVDNPLCGPRGADKNLVKQLDQALMQLEKVSQPILEQHNPCNTLEKPIAKQAGTGAAGGLGFTLKGFLAAELQSGAELVLQTLNISKNLNSIDLVITGEGQIDWQTQFGKAPWQLMLAAHQKHIPVIGLCGRKGRGWQQLLSNGDSKGFRLIKSITPNHQTIDQAMANAETNLFQASYQVIKQWQN